MKIFHTIISLLCPLLMFYDVIAQNIGIGTNSPVARLDIIKPAGDTPTLIVRGSQYISRFNWGANEDTYISGGKPGSNVILNDQDTGPVGIGTALGTFPLTFSPLLGDKISLWGNSGAHYGFGIQSLLMQIHTDQSTSDIAFGYGSSTSFTENMRIRGNGNVGIGTGDPIFRLDIADRMRIRSGGGFSTAGLYLNNNANTAFPAFIGMEDDTHVGFWGSGVGWRFTMNTQTGALKVNGSEGLAGQTITSTGGGASEWRAPTKAVFDLTTIVTQTTSITMVNGGGVTEIPGMSHTFTVTSSTKVLLNLNLNLYTPGCVFCGASRVWLQVQLDGTTFLTTINDVENAMQVIMPVTGLVTVPAGSHTIRVVANITGPDIQFTGNQTYSGRMVLQMIPG